jgi:CheY-like chemotaxis protein
MPILVVDDEAQVRCLLKRILVCHGFTVVEADDGTSALGKVREMGGHIAGLITDIDMTGMTGIDLAKRVASEFPKIPILFVSSAAPESTKAVAGSAFLAKPFHPATLVDAVQRLVQPKSSLAN